MFIRWLFTVFPVEMQAGWRLVRRDLVLWIALAGLLALASAGAPTEGDPGLNFATFIGVSTARLTAGLPAILFEAAARDADDRVALTAVWKSTSVSGARYAAELDTRRKILISTQVDGRRVGARRAPTA